MHAVWSVVCRNPRSQTHRLMLLPATDIELGAHVEHTVADVAVTAVEYLWIPHCVQARDPALTL